MLNDALEDYFHFLQIERGLSENTLKSYRRDLKDYTNFLVKKLEVKSWNSVTRIEIIHFLYALKDGGKSTSTISRHISSIRSFHQFLVREKVVNQDVSLHIETPKKKENFQTFYPKQR